VCPFPVWFDSCLAPTWPLTCFFLRSSARSAVPPRDAPEIHGPTWTRTRALRRNSAGYPRRPTMPSFKGHVVSGSRNPAPKNAGHTTSSSCRGTRVLLVDDPQVQRLSELSRSKRLPVWLYPRERWSDERSALGPQHDSLRPCPTPRAPVSRRRERIRDRPARACRRIRP
jgi:hypothetical protein